MSKKLIKGTESIQKEEEPFTMYSKDGKTTEIERSGTVCIPDYKGAEAFIEASQDAGCVYEGIDGPGVYIWNDETFEYTRIADDCKSDSHKEYILNIGQSLVHFSEAL